MVSNATFNNMSVISRRSVLLVDETEYPEKTTDLSQVTAKPGIGSNVVEMVPYPLYFVLYTYDAGLTKGF